MEYYPVSTLSSFYPGIPHVYLNAKLPL